MEMGKFLPEQSLTTPVRLGVEDCVEMTGSCNPN